FSVVGQDGTRGSSTRAAGTPASWPVSSSTTLSAVNCSRVSLISLTSGSLRPETVMTRRIVTPEPGPDRSHGSSCPAVAPEHELQPKARKPMVSTAQVWLRMIAPCPQLRSRPVGADEAPPLTTMTGMEPRREMAAQAWPNRPRPNWEGYLHRLRRRWPDCGRQRWPRRDPTFWARDSL